MKLSSVIIAVLLCLTHFVADAATRYVDASPHTPVSPYTSWATAATNIQDAINVANFGETILVNDGVYKFGGISSARINSVNKFPVIRSVNGPDVTIVRGQSGYMCANLTDGTVLSGFTLMNSTNTSSAGGVFCATTNCLVTNCIIANCSGLTAGGIMRGTVIDCVLTNNSGRVGGALSNILINCTIISNHGSFGGGAASASLSNCLLVANDCSGSGSYAGGALQSVLISCTVSNNYAFGGNSFGGGGGLNLCIARDSLISSNRIFGSSGGGTYFCGLSNCVVQNNYSGASGGGGVYGGSLTNCVIANNATDQFGRQGGGVANATLNHCLVTGNAATFGAGVASGTGNNCTIANNAAIGSGSAAGAFNSIFKNSIIYFNQAFTNANISGCALTNCCTPSLAYPKIANSFTNEPSFVDANGDFHLQYDSPCINAGNNSFASNTNDLDGNPRIVGGTVDVGAYEFQAPASTLSYAWLLQYGLPTDGSVDDTDDDGDGMTTRQEWITGTDPTDAASLLQMISATPTNNFSRVTVSWQSVGGKNYLLQRSANLSAFSTIQSNLVGAAGTTSYADTTTTNSTKFFYRVAVQ